MKKKFDCKIIGKDRIIKGLIFKKEVYIIALEFINYNKTTTTEIPFHQYCMLELGKTYQFEMESDDGNIWYFVRS